MDKRRKVDPRALVKKLSQESKELLQREIIAPLLPNGKIRTRLGGMVYEFKPTSNFVGWGRFQPINEREVAVQGEALPWERGGYLELLPALRVILLWSDPHPARPGTWWAIPFNESDAQQRFRLPMEPVPVFLCDATNGAQQFERVVARVDGRTLWFEGPDTLADPAQAEWLRDASTRNEEPGEFLSGLSGSQRLALLFQQIHQLETVQPEADEVDSNSNQPNQEEDQYNYYQAQSSQYQRPRRRQPRQFSIEEQLRHALSKADATLRSYSELDNGHLVVEWNEKGQTRRYRSIVDRRLGVVSSGICLSGRDQDFDITSLVNVMTNDDW